MLTGKQRVIVSFIVRFLGTLHAGGCQHNLKRVPVRDCHLAIQTTEYPYEFEVLRTRLYRSCGREKNSGIFLEQAARFRRLCSGTRLEGRSRTAKKKPSGLPAGRPLTQVFQRWQHHNCWRAMVQQTTYFNAGRKCKQIPYRATP